MAKMKSGVYAIIQISENRVVYVGSSKTIEKRTIFHTGALKSGKHFNAHLQSAWNKYGAEDFTIVVLEETSDLVLREQHWIDLLKPACNVSIAADNAMRGRKHSEETLRKMREVKLGNKNALGRIVSEETRKKIGDAHRGKIISAEQREKLVIANISKNCETLEQYRSRKIFEASIKDIHRPLSEAHKEKLRQASSGKKHKPESIQKMREVQKGKVISPETRAKLSKANKGRVLGPMSEEHKQKISAAHRRRLISNG